MARLRVRGFGNDAVFPDYEIGPQDLINKLIGEFTGKQLQVATFTLETDDGQCVTISIPIPKPRRGPPQPATEMHATIQPRSWRTLAEARRP